MTTIADLAQREAAAEAQKGKADIEWRRAWWATTLALGQTESNLGDAQKTVAEATGRSIGWIKSRTRAGRKFGVLKNPAILPPRMAVSVSDTQIEVTEDLARQIVKAEQDGESLRAFTERITGKAWSGTPAGMSPGAIRDLVHAQPEVVARIVVEQQPQHVRAALHVQHRDEVVSVGGYDPDLGPEPFPTDVLMEAERIAGRLSGEVSDLIRLQRRCEPDQWAQVVGILEPRMTALTRAVFGEVTVR